MPTPSATIGRFRLASACGRVRHPQARARCQMPRSNPEGADLRVGRRHRTTSTPAQATEISLELRALLWFEIHTYLLSCHCEGASRKLSLGPWRIILQT